MKIKVLTLFPEMFEPILHGSILGRAIRAGHISVECVNIRDYTNDPHNRTDDYPFGGGAGMVMFAQPIVDAFEAVDPGHVARRLYMSPRGRTLTQRVVEELSKDEELVLLCGHYEGVDERALEMCVDEELSIGDYVLTGGELAAMVVIDSVARLVPGVLGSAESGEDESFTTGLLEYPQYTRPADFRGERVPEVLLGGNHADIVAWRREKSLALTLHKRPELIDTAPLDDSDRAMLERLKAAGTLLSWFEEKGISAWRMDMLFTDAFAKRWIDAFVPAENRKTARKICRSGRRHVGYLYQAFEQQLAEALVDVEAVEAFARHKDEECFLYLQEKEIAFRMPVEALTSAILQTIGRFVVTDVDFQWTYARGKRDYFA